MDRFLSNGALSRRSPIFGAKMGLKWAKRVKSKNGKKRPGILCQCIIPPNFVEFRQAVTEKIFKQDSSGRRRRGRGTQSDDIELSA